MPETMVLINLSNRHIHLCAEDVEKLFGAGYKLTKTKDLIQPGQFACDETVTIKGPKSALTKVRILGPERKETQCEILSSDVFKLGVPGCPVCESGKLDGSFPFEIEGPKGTIKKDRGLIIAKRHIHFAPNDGKAFGVTDGEVVDLKIAGEKGALFYNVICRVNEAYALECHIDFDEGNAVGIGNGAMGEIIKR